MNIIEFNNEDLVNINKLTDQRNDKIEHLVQVLKVYDDVTEKKSSELLQDIFKINSQLKLEEHKLITKRLINNKPNCPKIKICNVTATMIKTPSDKGRGMNNENLYGKVIYQMLPIEAIARGKMVRPRLHIVTTDGVYNTNDYNKSRNYIIKDTYIQHQEVLNKTNQIAKLLISTKGTQDIRDFINSRECNYLKSIGVDIYCVSSTDEIGSQINGERITRQEFLKRIKIDGENPLKKMIVLHYDILAEGIDVSGFTGIMPLRTLSKSKFLQTYGRAARLDKIDRIKIDKEELNVNDLSHFKKPYAYILIPNIIHSNEDDKENMIAIINELRTYGFNPSEDIISSSIINGIPQHEQLDGLNNVIRRIPKIGVLIENLNADIEAEENAKLSKLELLQKEFSNQI